MQGIGKKGAQRIHIHIGTSILGTKAKIFGYLEPFFRVFGAWVSQFLMWDNGCIVMFLGNELRLAPWMII